MTFVRALLERCSAKESPIFAQVIKPGPIRAHNLAAFLPSPLPTYAEKENCDAILMRTTMQAYFDADR